MTNTANLNLTEEERQLILNLRLNAIELKARHEHISHLIRTAADYRDWLEEHDRTASTEAFIDFGYECEGEGALIKAHIQIKDIIMTAEIMEARRQ